MHAAEYRGINVKQPLIRCQITRCAAWQFTRTAVLIEFHEKATCTSVVLSRVIGRFDVRVSSRRRTADGILMVRRIRCPTGCWCWRWCVRGTYPMRTARICKNAACFHLLRRWLWMRPCWAVRYVTCVGRSLTGVCSTARARHATHVSDTTAA